MASTPLPPTNSEFGVTTSSFTDPWKKCLNIATRAKFSGETSTLDEQREAKQNKKLVCLKFACVSLVCIILLLECTIGIGETYVGAMLIFSM